MGLVPGTAPVVRMRLTRERARRREAVAMLRLGEMMCGYAAAQLGDGLPPEQARLAAVEVASELAEVAAALRRLARLSASERRLLVHRLTGLGLSRVEVARRLGYRSGRCTAACGRVGAIQRRVIPDRAGVSGVVLAEQPGDQPRQGNPPNVRHRRAAALVFGYPSMSLRRLASASD